MSVKLTEAQANKCSDSLPTKWTWVRLNEVVLNPTADIVDGPFGSNLHASEYVDEGVPLVRLQNVERNMFVNKNIQCITSKKAAELKRHSYSPNNILITKLGQPLGKACLVPQNIKSGIVVADVVRVKIDHDWVSKKYLVYAINSNIVIEQIPRPKGTTRPRVNLGIIRNLRVPLAPIYEQHRIVSKLEELFTKLDAGIDALKKTKIQLKNYRQSILKHAFEGKLTEKWRGIHKDEIQPLSMLLEKIKAERRRNTSQDDDFPITKILKVSELPEDWIWTSLGEITINYDGIRVPVKRKDREKRDGIFPYYGASGIIDFVDDYLFDGEFLLIGEDGANLLARSKPIAFQAKGKFWVNNHAHILRTYGGVPLTYLEHLINSFELQFFVTGTAQPKLTQVSMNRIPVPLPSLQEQIKIVDEIDYHFSVINNGEKVVENSIKQAEILRHTILKQAFEGKLVLQNPGDEDAGILLERIREEKAKKGIVQKMDKTINNKLDNKQGRLFNA